jgi:hypothetical protein
MPYKEKLKGFFGMVNGLVIISLFLHDALFIIVCYASPLPKIVCLLYVSFRPLDT